MNFYQLWHERAQISTPNRWLRKLTQEVARAAIHESQKN
jgi:hypothetical protein